MPTATDQKTRQITVRLSDRQVNLLALASDITGKDQSALVRESVEAYLGDFPAFADKVLLETKDAIERSVKAIENLDGG